MRERARRAATWVTHWTVLGLVASASLGACTSTPEATDCSDEALCESAAIVRVEPSGGATVPAGVYDFDLEFDGRRTHEACTVGEGLGTQRCDGGMVTLVQRDLSTFAFQIKGPAAQKVSVTIRGLCSSSPLATHTFEPTYACATGCRMAELTMPLPTAAPRLCDAGTD